MLVHSQSVRSLLFRTIASPSCLDELGREPPEASALQSPRRNFAVRHLYPHASAAVLLMAGFLAGIMPLSSRAAPRTWGNTGTSFTAGGNWVGGVAPADNLTSDIGVFTAATPVNNPQLPSGLIPFFFGSTRSVAGLEFASGTGAWTFGAGASLATLNLVLGASGIVNNSSSTQTFTSGPLVLQLGANAAFSGSAGTLNFDASMDSIRLGGFNLTLGGAVGGTVGTVISGNGSIIKTGAGIWTLSGANTYTGSTSVGSAGGTNGGTLTLGANNVLPDTTVNVFGGTLNVNTRTDTIGALNLGGGAAGSTAQVTIGSGGLLTLGGGVTYSAANNPNGALISGAGTLALGGNRTINVGDSAAAAADLTISTVISGSGFAITKTGAGVLVLGADNTYTGGTLVSAGVLQIGTGGLAGTLGGGNVTNNGGLVLNRDGTLLVTNIISGTGGLTNAGPGVTLLSAANTYTGNTTVNGGTLRLTNAGTLGVANGITVSADGLFGNSATLDLNNINAAIGSLTLAGPTAPGGSGAPKTTLVTSGTGTLTLGGNVLYNGDQGNQASSTIAGHLNMGGTTRTFTVNGTTNATLNVTASVSAGPGQGLVKAGAAVLSLGGSNSFNGNLAINQGTVVLGHTNALAGGGNISFGGGTLRYSSNNAADISGRIFNSSGAISIDTAGRNATWATSIDASNTNGLSKLGAGTLTLAAANAYTGGTTINAGTLAISASNNLPTGTINLTGGTLLSLSGTYALGTNRGIVLAAPGTITAQSGHLTINGTVTNGGHSLTLAGAGDMTVSGIISGTGGLVKTNTGTLTLSGANSYTGPVAITQGVVIARNNNALGADLTGTATVSGGATVALADDIAINLQLVLGGDGAGGLGALRNLSGSNSLLAPVSLAADTRIAADSGTLTFSNTLSGTNNTLTVGGLGNLKFAALSIGTDATIIKSGAGTLTLGGPSDHENTTIQAGQLDVNNVIALGSSAGGTVTFGNGARLDNTSGASLNVSVARGITVGSSLEFLGTHSLGMGSGTLSLGNPDTNGYTTFNVLNNLLAFDGQITGTSGIIKTGAGTLQLGFGGSNSFTGLTLVDQGELFVSGPGVSFANELWANPGGTIRIGAGVNLGTTVVDNGGTIINTTLSDYDLFLAVDTVLTANNQLQNGFLTIGAGVTVTNPGITDLLSFTPTNFIANRVTFQGGSRLVVTDGFTIGANKGIVIETNTVTFQVDANDLLVNSPITGGATLRKTGAGHIHLFGSNSYAGGTLIEEGWVGILADSALGTGKVTLAGGVLEGGFEASPTNVLVTVDSNRIVEMVKGTTSFMIGQVNTTLRYDGNIAEVGTNSGPANLVVGLPAVSGTVELGGTNTYSGFTRIQNGATLSIKVLADGGIASGVGTSSSAATNLVLNGGTLRYTGGAVSTDRLFSIGAQGGTIDSSGSGALDFTNSGTIGYNGQTGFRTLTLAGTAGGSLAVSIGDNVDATSLAKTGTGTWTLSGSNTYTGGTTIQQGALRVGSDANLGSGGAVAFSTNSTGRLTVTGNLSTSREVSLLGDGIIETLAGTTTELTGAVSGAGGLAKEGAGTLVLAASNSFSGGMLLGDGELRITAPGGLGSGDVTNNSSLVLVGDLARISNTITGTGSLFKTGGSGAPFTRLTGDGSNTYTGLTTVDSGVLQLDKTNGALAIGGDVLLSGTLILLGHEQIVDTATVTMVDGNFNFGLVGDRPPGRTETIEAFHQSGGDLRTFGNTLSAATFERTGGTNVAETELNARDGVAGTLLVRSGGDGLILGGADSPEIWINSDDTVTNRIILQGSLTADVTDGTASILNRGSLTNRGTIDLGGGTRTFAISNGLAGVDMFIDASIANGGLDKTGAGRLVLAGESSYAGGTTLSAGQLRLDTTTAAGTGTITQTDGSSWVEINTSGTVANNMSLYKIAYLQDATLSGNLTLNNTEFFVTNGVTSTNTGVIGGTSGIQKTGAGTLVLAGTTNNTFTGASSVEAGSLVLSNTPGQTAITGTNIRVDGGATLVLAADDQIGDTTGLILNGGTFITGTSTTGFNETLGTLTLSASSTIDLGSYSADFRSLRFADSSAIAWAPAAILTIANWQGVEWTPSTVTQILFGPDGLTPTQLSQIQFSNFPLQGGGLVGLDGELTPIPEPRVYAAALALVLAVGWRERRRIRRLLRR